MRTNENDCLKARTKREDTNNEEDKKGEGILRTMTNLRMIRKKRHINDYENDEDDEHEY